MNQSREANANVLQLPMKKLSWEDIGIGFLRNVDKWKTLKHWRDNFYRFDGVKYISAARTDLSIAITNELNRVWDRAYRKNEVDEIIFQLRAITNIEADQEPPMLLSEKGVMRKDIVFRNAIVRVDREQQKYSVLSEPPSPDYFNFVAIPHDYIEDAECPIWRRTLEQILPDKEMRDLIQELFGYCLYQDTSAEKLFLFLGKGANGKSVVLLVLRLLLGDNNVSSVRLEDFKDKFRLSSTFGKLSNIVEEISNIKSFDEGLLKNFVTGASPIQVERKYQNPFDFRPTARLVFAANQLPRFQDTSDGLWRRLIVAPFNVCIEERLRNRNLITPEFWMQSGELPGIAIWALKGLKRVLRRNCEFALPETCRAMVEEFQAESNFTDRFLEESIEEVEGKQLSSNELFKAYADHCAELGEDKLSQSQFYSRVQALFPKARKSKNPVTIGKKRLRIWQNIDFRK